MTKLYWNLDQPGKRCMLSGNEAAARGALESGVQVITSYPGSPSVQILECLAAVGHERGIYAEWSINEKVALEIAAAGSFSGIRALSVMKADGLNVALDFLTTLHLSGIDGGMVIVVSDDPGAHSSVKEEDSRYLAPPAHVPLLEPTGPQETKDILIWAFDLSEKVGLPVIVRLTTRICHARATVTLGRIRIGKRSPKFPVETGFITAGRFHPDAHKKLDLVQDQFEASPFNLYTGAEEPELIIFTSGVSHSYALEAVERLGVGERIGVFKTGTVWPLPEGLVLKVLKRSDRVVFFEEIEPFLEDQTKILAAQHWEEVGPLTFLGKRSGDVPWVKKSRGMGEMDPDITTQALANALDIPFEPGAVRIKEEIKRLPEMDLPLRFPTLCPGCPHRASYWAIKTALELDGREGVALGDIGCYALGVLPTGYGTIRTVHSMGSGLGIASGLGKLKEMGFDQPAIAVIGDSTFYHAGIPPLINAKNTHSQCLCIILDNDTTAMTGHQPHPGSGLTAMGEATPPVPVAELVRGLDIPLTIGDPYQVEEIIQTILGLLGKGGPQVLLLQRECALKAGREQEFPRVYVDQERCLGDACGCSRLCGRVFSCPANIWDEEAGKAMIDDVLCMGCGVCASLCPEEAIVVESERRKNDPGF
ncbi:MAG: 4Fe-4S binding protein [Desulfobacteraceae bacterium]|nr:4Fe-4S binding protein [Desulfobacteraceae bacterium]